MAVNRKRNIAVVVSIVCAMFSIFMIGGIKLGAFSSKLEDTFFYGTDRELSSRHSMDAYLDRCSEYSAELAYEAEQYIDDRSLIDSVLSLSAELSETDGSKGRYSKYVELTSAVESLCSALQKAGASNEVAVTTAYHDYASAQNLIKNDGYVMQAIDFNKKLDRFPANIIASIWNVRKADTFGN